MIYMSNSFTDWDRNMHVLIHYEPPVSYDEQEINQVFSKILPDYTPEIAVPYGNAIYVNLVPNDSSDFNLMEWHAFDPKTKKVTGQIPIDYLFNDTDFVTKLKNRAIKLNSSLTHHGIKGQKWGVRRFQNSDGSLTAAGRARYGREKSSSVLKRSESVKYAGRALNATTTIARSVVEGVLRSIPGVGLAMNAVYAARLGKYAYNVGAKAFSTEEKQNQKFAKYADIDTKIKSEKDVNRIDGEHTDKQDLAAINPSHKALLSSPGSTNNCMFCTTAYDLRRRGYDVTAKAGFGRSQSSVKDWYKGVKVEPSGSKTWKEFSEKLSKFPDGARGNLMVQTFTTFDHAPSGHSMIWEKSGGKITIKDAQVNKSYSVDSFYMKNNWDVKTATYARTDNCPINWAAMTDVVANRKKKN